MTSTAECSTLITTGDLAMMGATLANGGINPVTGKRVINKPTWRPCWP